MELLNQIIISSDLKYLNELSEEDFRTQIDKVAKKINALRKSAMKKKSSNT